MTRHAPLWAGLGLVAAGLVVMAVGAAACMPGPNSAYPYGMGPMMGGAPAGAGQPSPGSEGFVPGTASSPRVVRIVATPQLRFLPDSVTVEQGETILFEVSTMGPIVHEFMVGPAADVAADTPGTPEIADLGMMETRSLTYTFDGPGPYAFACHVTGHYEAGMRGTITIVP